MWHLEPDLTVSRLTETKLSQWPLELTTWVNLALNSSKVCKLSEFLSWLMLEESKDFPFQKNSFKYYVYHRVGDKDLPIIIANYSIFLSLLPHFSPPKRANCKIVYICDTSWENSVSMYIWSNIGTETKKYLSQLMASWMSTAEPCLGNQFSPPSEW